MLVSDGDTMKITRAYTIDRQTLGILKTKKNKSQYVCRAVKRLDANEGQLQLYELPVEELLMHCANRGGCAQHIAAVIKEHFQIHK